MKLLIQSIIILLSLALVGVVINTQLIDYIAYILSLLIIFSTLFVLNKKRAQKDAEILSGSALEVATIILAVLLLIFTTGGLTSSIFFLTYFVLFGIAFMFEPTTIFVFLIGLIALFFPTAIENDVFSNFIKLGSLALLSPLAYFFGQEFKKREHLEEEIEEKTNKIIEDADSLLNSEPLSKEGQQKAKEILEETEKLKKQ